MAVIQLYFPEILSFGDDYDPLSMIQERPVLLLSIIIVGPLIETLIQYIPVGIFSELFRACKYRFCISIIISALIFGLLHRSGLLYFVPLFIAGAIWAFLCLLFIRKKKKAYLLITIIHALYNAVLLVIDYVSS
ncbi:MAG: CPBP family intramembrane metalloprotease [Tannerella sp.]|nr:CPBP family intramembrane metalloprotease [Tannerella sp.]